MDCRMTYASPLGKMLLSADDEGLTGAWFLGQKYYASRLENACDVTNAFRDFNSAQTCERELGSFENNVQNLVIDPSFYEVTNSKPFQILSRAKCWFDHYFSGEEPCVEVPLHLIGSDFQREVWEILQTIPYGKTITYGDIAKQIATRRGLSRMSAQAVGGTVGHNPLSVIVPCHRVVGSNGNLTGYAGGIDKKEALLTLEGVEVSNHSISTSNKATQPLSRT